MGPVEGGRHYLHYLHHSLTSGQTTGREHSPAHQQKIGLMVYWACVSVSHSVMPDSLHPMDCSPPGSSVHEIFQARILEWVAISFSRGSSQPRDQTQVSCTAGRFFTKWATREAPYWAWPCPFEQDAVYPSVSLSHQETSISFLSFSIRGQKGWKTQSQKTNQSDYMDHNLV